MIFLFLFLLFFEIFLLLKNAHATRGFGGNDYCKTTWSTALIVRFRNAPTVVHGQWTLDIDGHWAILVTGLLWTLNTGRWTLDNDGHWAILGTGLLWTLG